VCQWTGALASKVCYNNTMSKELVPQGEKPITSTELIRDIKHDKQRAFLETYHKCNMRTNHTAQAVGVNESTIYGWIKSDVIFRQAFQVLKSELEAVMIDKYLDNIRSITFDKNVPPQSRLLGSFFELKALDPKYKDRQDTGPQVATQIVIHTSIPEPEYKTIEGEYTETTQEANNATK